MCQKQNLFFKKIHSQINVVFKLIDNFKCRLSSLSNARNFDQMTIRQIIIMEQFVSKIKIFDDEDDDLDSIQQRSSFDCDERNFKQIVGIANEKVQPGNKRNKQINIQNMKISHEQNASGQIDEKSFSYIRGPYRTYSDKQKLNAIQLHKSGRTYSYISRNLRIPQKNIIRWCRYGVQRKQGGGRKVLDAQMQNKVLSWIKNTFKLGQTIKSKEIRLKAKLFSNKEQFKSSKGWLKNFGKRYELDKNYDII